MPALPAWISEYTGDAQLRAASWPVYSPSVSTPAPQTICTGGQLLQYQIPLRLNVDAQTSTGSGVRMVEGNTSVIEIFVQLRNFDGTDDAAKSVMFAWPH